ncbi:MAG TPA: SDR family NAD(P)-dependent oxidoreductase, partial [Acidimicrobiales bacterium]|nr:SDR family NAD(P)-dependent oxidoreductase [Acidimicrobiales bacterium]
MELAGRCVVVTGGASGIGRALCQRFARERPAGLVVADLDGAGAGEVAEQIARSGAPCLGVQADVTRQQDVSELVSRAEASFGPVDLFCSNAGVAVAGSVEVPDQDWLLAWETNVMAHVRAARAVLPSMLARGEGYLLSTASAAGLLTNLGAAPYSVTKHAAVALAEWLAITYGDRGIKVSCVCPQGVRTPMLLGGAGSVGAAAVMAAGGLLDPEDVAEAVVEGLASERFLILPHPEVAEHYRRRA